MTFPRPTPNICDSAKVPPGVKNEYLKAPWFLALTRDQGDAYIERISILCEDGPVTKEAHEIAMAEAKLVLKPCSADLAIAIQKAPGAVFGRIEVDRQTPYEDLFGHTPPAAPLPREVRMQNAFDKLRRVG